MFRFPDIIAGAFPVGVRLPGPRSFHPRWGLIPRKWVPKAAELRAPDPPDQGGVYFEVHTPGVYRDLFGTLQAFDPLDQQMPLALSLPAKVGSWRDGADQRGRGFRG